MTINFPASPNTGDTYAYNGVTYTYDGVKWTAAGAGAAALWTRTGTVLSPATAGDDVQIASLNSGPLAGFRNVLINGNLTVNQRGVDVATAATGSYGQDRWKKTAGGMTQIIEEGNFEPGATYTLSGTGITTQQLTAPASGNWTIPDVPVTARKIQLELGPVATPFEHRPIGMEMDLCRRYYVPGNDGSIYQAGVTTEVGAATKVDIRLSEQVMRANPTLIGDLKYYTTRPGDIRVALTVISSFIYKGQPYVRCTPGSTGSLIRALNTLPALDAEL